MEELNVLYEDNHLIAVNKPARVLVQGDKTGDEHLADIVKEYIRKKYNKPGQVFCGVIHRLDRPVSGVVVFARTSKGLERMNALFQNKDLDKTYLALVSNRPPEDEDEIMNYLVKDPEKNITKAYTRQVKGSKPSTLRYKILGKVNRYYLLEIHPKTGRSHQIRAQLAKIGCPIKGDIKYGYPEKNKDGRIHLHAFKLDFIHPVKKEPVRIQAALPKDQVWREYVQLARDV
ncbi:RluA family pseudouridine synthase [Flammeovirgaceae bacterium SG7u.111]|nr:RluA family pseudouridine synthase [Flammeovirgaceae bacterium SG7u.132]WPO35237.1 RluA family pseudouridine synthase [Flammeovirgaceae bacterium SG7u.111]